MPRKRKKPLTPDQAFSDPAVVEPQEPPKRARKLNASTMMEAKARASASAPEDGASTNRQWLEPYKWKPGQSGNPNGRPKSTDDMKRRFQQLTDVAADIIEMKARLQAMRLQKAIDMLSDPKTSLEDFDLAVAVIEGTDMDAVTAILDRGHGKPNQNINLDHRTFFDDLDPEQFDAWLVETGQKVTAAMIARRNRGKAIEHDEGQRESPRTDRARKAGARSAGGED